MLSGMSPLSLILIIVIVLVLLAGKKFRDNGGDVKKAVKGFKKAMTENDAAESKARIIEGEARKVDDE